MRAKRLIVNTAAMTATSLVIRLAGLGFQVFLARRLGKEGVGLFHLIMSVSGFLATLAISGVRFSTTRLISEELGRGNEGKIRPIMRRSLCYAAICGTASLLLVLILAEPVGVSVIGDERTVRSLRLLGLSLPFLSMGACLSGYFTGVGRATKGALGAVFEETVKISASFALLSIVKTADIETLASLVVIGNVAGELFGFLFRFILYRFDVSRFEADRNNGAGLLKRLLSISLPLAVAAYGRTALTSLQNTLIPRGLKASGISSEAALAEYGTIQGMVFPVVTFPSVIFASISELIVPELTEEQVRGNDELISDAANRLLKYCLLFSMGVMGALICLGDGLGEAVYSDSSVGEYIRLFAFLMPIMYMDTVTDGMLRGLGEHLYSMRLNIVDSLCSLILVIVLVPRFAVKGYVFVLYASEIFNFTLSMLRLMKRANIDSLIPEILKSALAAVGAANITALADKAGNIGLIASALTFIATYFIFLVLFMTFNEKELKAMHIPVFSVHNKAVPKKEA